MSEESFAKIENALVSLARRATDPRGNTEINDLAGVAMERSGAVMLWRLGEIEPARLSDLADAVGVDISSASRPVARLVDQGYVERSEDPTDGRASVHRLTPAGRDVRQRLVEARHQWLESLLGGFDATEREQFADLLDRFVNQLMRRS